MGGFASLIKAQAILSLLRHAQKDEIIPDLVETIDTIAGKHLGGHDERIQAKVVEDILLPIARELVSDDAESIKRYRLLLTRELELIQGRIEAGGDEKNEIKRSN